MHMEALLKISHQALQIKYASRMQPMIIGLDHLTQQVVLTALARAARACRGLGGSLSSCASTFPTHALQLLTVLGVGGSGFDIGWCSPNGCWHQAPRI